MMVESTGSNALDEYKKQYQYMAKFKPIFVDALGKALKESSQDYSLQSTDSGFLIEFFDLAAHFQYRPTGTLVRIQHKSKVSECNYGLGLSDKGQILMQHLANADAPGMLGDFDGTFLITRFINPVLEDRLHEQLSTVKEDFKK